MKSNFRKEGLAFLAVLLAIAIPATGETATVDSGAAVSGQNPNGSETMTLTVDDAVTFALANNESLKQAAIALETKRRAAGVSWNALIPTLTVGAGVVQTNSDILANGTTATTFAQIPVSLSLALNASVPQVLEATKLAYEGQLVAYNKARQSLALSIRTSFYKILLDKAQLDLARQNVKRQQSSFEQTESKYKAGLVSELDYLKAKVSFETLKPTEQGYAITLQNDVDAFRNSLGLKPDAEIDVTGKLDIDTSVTATVVAEAMKKDPSANPSVQSAVNALASAKVTAAKAFNSYYLPSLSLSGTVTPKTPLSSSGSMTASSTLSASVSVALDNYLPFSSAHQTVSAANDAVASAQSALEDAIRTTQVSRMSYKRSSESYRDTLGVLKMNEDLTQRAYDATKAAYDRGLETMTNLLAAAGNLETAQFDALSKSYSLIAALLTLQYETGMPLDTTGRF